MSGLWVGAMIVKLKAGHNVDKNILIVGMLGAYAHSLVQMPHVSCASSSLLPLWLSINTALTFFCQRKRVLGKLHVVDFMNANVPL